MTPGKGSMAAHLNNFNGVNAKMTRATNRSAHVMKNLAASKAGRAASRFGAKISSNQGVNKIGSTLKGTASGLGSGMMNDARIARSMASGAKSAYSAAGGGFGGMKAAGLDAYHRGGLAWRNSSNADKMRYAGYGAAGVAGVAWGLSGD